MKINFFKEDSPLFQVRWFIIVAIAASIFMAWHDIVGGRVFTRQASQQQWSSSGPGYHK